MAEAGGLEALHRLKSADPPVYLSPSLDLSQAARIASEYLFSSLKPFTPKSPFDRLLVNGFDAEQIWQQIDLQSQPLISSLRREVKKFEKKPEEISRFLGQVEKKGIAKEKKDNDLERDEEGFEGLDAMEGDFEDFGDEVEDEDEDEDEQGEEEEEDRDNKDEEDEEGEEDGGGDDGGVEDRFLKIKELEEYLEEDEAREYGLKKKKKGDGNVPHDDEDGSEEDEEGGEDEEEDGEEDELGLLGADIDDDAEDEEVLENARYEDFFGPKKKNDQKKKSKMIDGSHDLEMDDYRDDKVFDNQNLSTHEKELEKLRSKIEQMEKANLEPKTWTMQGEVTAAKRPKNSALEVDLDFEHNIRPAPVITEEVTASLEELIQKRILEGHFDDVQKPPSLPSKAQKEFKELDENKSKKGLAEIYEDEYVQKTGLVSTALSFSDEQKKEASMLFKKLCLKLDALSHFHFTPKPVIEDMSIQSNVPALAMEEIAPMAVSDAAMLAPEEVFAGKGDIKEETELTQADRKRRRAKKKRKFKAEEVKRTAAKKARENASGNRTDGRQNHEVQP